ncbi:nucleoside permease [Arachidicoccus ginsenosidimutans]|uniref:nucleoside permease n=1 Tax=Arachidicoccus sp. BS20 TaxID=1850526 RepID=UPI0007F07B9A|nr:nucleoside permease [Arachidicoccus sp. BS20]ANI88407.1 nucleoside permease [Arachidicoccus sp. BS20]
MNIKLRLIAMNFMQFFIWGAWLLTVGKYCSNTMHWTFSQFGAIFGTMGISAVFMPALMGIVADRLISAQKLYGTLHIFAAVLLCYLPQINNPVTFFWAMLVNMFFYMPTLSLSITVSYNSLKKYNIDDVVKAFPPIRTWGTIGFIVALWLVSLTKNENSANQFYIAGAVSFLLGVYSFSLPDCPPLGKSMRSKSFADALGLSAFKLFKNKRFAVFFLFSMLLGAALQLTNAYGDTFLGDFGKDYPDSFMVTHSAVVMSISQISETLFILAIPFFLKKFGIKYVMLMSMVAWVLRFGLFAYGNPGDNFWMIILSCIVYGMAFDFFNISGSLFIETQTHETIRASAQGLFMMMVNGFGAIIGSFTSGVLIDKYFILSNGDKDWKGIWIMFALYALVLSIVFPVVFKNKHEQGTLESFHH